MELSPETITLALDALRTAKRLQWNAANHGGSGQQWRDFAWTQHHKIEVAIEELETFAGVTERPGASLPS